jgi:hypothetical protein
MFGAQAGNLSTGSQNTFLGYQTALAAQSSLNTIVGFQAATNLTMGGNNVVIGGFAGGNLATGNNNVIIGLQAGNRGSQNVVVGGSAGTSTTPSSLNNTLVGYATGNTLTAGTNNTFLGAFVGFGATSGQLNTFVGFGSGRLGSRNTIVGSLSGNATTNGAQDNTIVGYAAGNTLTSGNNNTLLGSGSGYGLLTGINNTVLGAQSGIGLSTGGSNTVIGYNSSCQGDYNIVVGSDAGYTLGASNINNVVIGASATANGIYNLAVGSSAGSLSVGDENVFLGRSAGQSSGGNRNLFIGKGSGPGVKGSDNIAIGSDCGTQSTGSTNILIGTSCGTQTIGGNNIGIGQDVVFGVADQCVYIGANVKCSPIMSASNPSAQNYGLGRNILFGNIVGSAGAVLSCAALGTDISYGPTGPGTASTLRCSNVTVVGANITIYRANNLCVFGRDSAATNRGGLVSLCNNNEWVTLAGNGDFTITGAAFKPGGGSWTATSDRRLKHDITTANTIMCEDLVRTLDLKKFTWNDEMNSADKNQLGFIAQEVEEFMPKSVLTRNMYDIEDCKLLDVSQLQMSMYGALKRCIERIDNLETKLAALS